MALPKADAQWRKILLDTRCPVSVRLQALSQFNPSLYTLVKLLRAPGTPGRIRAAALAVYEQKKLLHDTKRKLRGN